MAFVLIGLLAVWGAIFPVHGQSAVWSFVSIESILPPSLPDAHVRHVGGQGVFEATDRLNGASSLHVFSHDTATQIYALGDDAPGGGVFNGFPLTSGPTVGGAYVVSPTLVLFQTSVLLPDSTSVPRTYRWENGALQHLPVPEGAIYDLRRNDAHGKFLASRELSLFSSEHWITDGITHGVPILLERTPNQNLTLRGITADGAFLIDEQVATDDFTDSFRVFFMGTRQDEIDSAVRVSSGGLKLKGSSGGSVRSIALNSIGDVMTHRFISAGEQLFLHRANGGTELVAETGAEFLRLPRNFGEVLLTLLPQAVFGVELTGDNPTRGEGALFFSGLSGAGHQIVTDFSGFGLPGKVGAVNTGRAHESGVGLFLTFLSDGTFVHVLGRAEITGDTGTLKWRNPAGGDFSTAGNWTPPRTPEHSPERSDTVVFELGGQYPVNATGARAGRMIVRNGIVDITGNTRVFSDSLTEPSLLVGNNGILNVVGGFFNSVNAAIGESSTAPGEVAVLDNGTRWENNGRLLVGDGGAGKLSVVNGFASALETRVGGGALAGGDVIVGGATGRFETGSVAVGFGGPGQLEIRDGGTVVSTSAEIGRVMTGPHTVEVYSEAMGAPSLWSVLDILAVASGGAGSLTIREGGEVEAGFVLIGNVGAGEIIVEGASVGGHRALLDVLNGATLLIGNGSPADLFVRGGGLVRSVGEIAIGNTTPGRAVVEGGVGEGESTLPSAIETTDEIVVGLHAEGSLRIAGGGHVFASELLAGSSPGSSAEIVIDGGFLNIDGGGRMGGGDSRMVLTNGIAAFEEKLDLGVTAGGKSAVSVFGGSSLLVKSDISLGELAESTLEAVDGALVSARDFSSLNKSGDYPVRATFRGRSPDGIASSLDVDNITWLSGDLEFLDGGRGGVESTGMQFGIHSSSALLIKGSGGGEPSRLRVRGDAQFGVGGMSTLIEIVDGGVLDVGGALYMGLFSGGLAVLTGEGSRIQSGGVFETAGPGFFLLVDAGGTLETGPVVLDTKESSLVKLEHPTAGTAWTVNGGMQVGSGTGTVSLVLCGASIVATDTVHIGPRGTLATFFGIVNAPRVVVEGVMVYQCTSPEESPETPVAKSTDSTDGPSTLTITGDLILEPDARVEMRVFGPDAGQADRLEVAGTLTAGGTLDIRFADGYLPVAGDQFALIAAPGGVVGDFDSVRFPGVDPAFEFDATATADGLSITALNDAVAAAPPRFDPLPFVTAGGLQLSIAAPAEQEVVIFAAPGVLLPAQPVHTNSGSFFFVDPIPSGEGRRFYRAVGR